MSTKKAVCSVRVVKGDRSWYSDSGPCSKPVVATIKGKPYCKVHHPDSVAKRRKKSEERFRVRSGISIIEKLQAEIDNLRQRLKAAQTVNGQLTADLLGCRDGALVRDLQRRNWELEKALALAHVVAGRKG